jgi:hypothetical protein
MKKYIEFYTSPGRYLGSEDELNITPEDGYIGMLFIVQGKNIENAKANASIACYTLRINDQGKLILTEDKDE